MNWSTSREPGAAPGAERSCGLLGLACGRTLLLRESLGRNGHGREIPRAPFSPSRAARQAGEMVCKTSPFSLSPTPSFLRLHFSTRVIAMKVIFSVFPLLRQCKERCRKTSASTYKKKTEAKVVSFLQCNCSTFFTNILGPALSFTLCLQPQSK